MSYFDLAAERLAAWQTLQRSVQQTPLSVSDFAGELQRLWQIDRFWAYPGREVLFRLTYYFEQSQWALITQLVNNCVDQLSTSSYRQQKFSPFSMNLELLDRPILHDDQQLESSLIVARKPYFEVLIIHPAPEAYEPLYREHLALFKSDHDEFIYDIVLVNSAQDALTAVLANSDIQACVYLNHILPATSDSVPLFIAYTASLISTTPPLSVEDSVEVNLCRTVQHLRPELDHYLISEQAASELPLALRHLFNRVLFHANPFQDLHSAILNGLRNRFSTPFFDALQGYSRQPKGSFHALPLSRGASVKGSPWIHDMVDFYGSNIFLAETSSTQGGMDSLLDPTGAIKQSHLKAAESFGSDSSYFVTNGTSTANKIVMQANLQPGDIVLISADCHKSIPYAVMLTGAYPIFLETYPLAEYDLYGGVDVAQIKAIMLDLKRQNRLHLLKQITLTNSTFDGLIYQCEAFMMEILAIKPDIVFHWDEAWFAFAHFHPLYHSRTAMSAVNKIRQRLRSSEYQTFYAQWFAAFEANHDEHKWQQVLYPDPNAVVLRVYATQSTHKTLTSFRQGSMIHVADDRFNLSYFIEAFRIYTSTSPNYQIIASLDIARRQAALEGFHLVRKTILLSLQLRQRIQTSSLLQPYFKVLSDDEMIPSSFRKSRVGQSVSGLSALSSDWGQSDFVVDPTRVTLDIRGSGIDGSSFRQLLMTRYDIQVNKTSRHTVLFLINIGATQATVDYLIHVLEDMAAHFQIELHSSRFLLSELTPILPSKRRYHPAFLPFSGGAYDALDMRRAYYQGQNAADTQYVPLSSQTLEAIKADSVYVSACFVTPYPPGYPVLVPGQIITVDIIVFFQHIKVKEIHGYCFERGFSVFSDDCLTRLTTPVSNFKPS
jgi:arginine decarboxylase